MRNIAIMGSCISRDNFNSNFNKNYQCAFKCHSLLHQFTVASACSKKVRYNEGVLEGLSPFVLNHLQGELDKEYLSKLIEDNTVDYILIDFYADLYEGILEIEENQFITNSSKFSGIDIFKENKNKSLHIMIDSQYDQYLSIWKKSFSEMICKLNKKYLNSQIIIVKFYFKTLCDNGMDINEFRQKNNIKIFDVDKANTILDTIYQYLEEEYGFSSIDMRDDNYLIDSKHAWKPFYVHYEKKFYDDFIWKLVQLDQKLSIYHEEKKLNAFENTMIKQKEIENKIKLDLERVKASNDILRSEIQKLKDRKLIDYLLKKNN
ncbi:DUF6270 domain-containing protein [Vagococcus salmoninarum]|uniref:DUF6270 domain-containing protein n=1 Tax=Vagococcus salmoninarum TaxID=2739 RepID=UPI003F9D07CF